MDLQQICTLSILGVAGFFVLIGVIWGLKRGMARSINRLITIVLSAVGAFLVSTKLFTTLLPTITVTIKGVLLQYLASLADVVNASDSLIQYLITIILALLAPIMYIVIFLILRVLTFVLYLFLNAFLPSKRKHPIKGGSRLVGMLISIVGGLVIAASILVPLAGIVSFASDNYDKIDGLYAEATGATESPLAPYKAYLTEVEGNQFITIINTTPLKEQVFDRLISLNGTIDLSAEIQSFSDGYPIIMEVIAIDYGGIFDSSKDLDLSPIEDDLLPFLGNNENFKAIIAEILSEAAGKWVANEAFMEINIKESFPEEYKDCMDGVLTKLSNTTKATVINDLQDLVDTVKSLASIYRYVSSMSDTSITLDSLTDDMTSILTNITPGSAEVIKSIVSESVISSVIEDEATASMVSAILSDTLDAVANMTDAEKAEEAEALTNIMTYLTSDRSDNIDSDEFVDTILDSSILSTVIVNQAESTGASIPVSAAEYAEINTYLEAKKLTASAEDKATLDALASLLAVNAETPAP